MRLTQKLLGYLPRFFDKSPGRVLALRLSYDGDMSWVVDNGVLTTTVSGGPGVGLTVDLKAYTFSSLVDFLASRMGYSIPYAAIDDVASISARALIDGSGSLSQSNGDHLYAYTSPLWAYVEAVGPELDAAGVQVGEMLRQMNTRTGEGIWLDEIGGYYGVLRKPFEVDGAYGSRIILEVLRPRGNNVAIEAAIREFTGQTTKVTDAVIFDGVTPAHNALVTHNGAALHNSESRPVYGLFDVNVGFDLLSGESPLEFALSVRALLENLRDAGTHLRALSLSGSDISDSFLFAPTEPGGDALSADPVLTDSVTGPTEDNAVIPLSIAGMTDAVSAGADDADIDISYLYQHNSTRSYNGVVLHNAGTSQEVLS